MSMSDARPSRFRDLSTWDAVIAATFGIAVSEGAGALGRVSGAGQIGTGMLAAGLLLGVRLCWPMRSSEWFWPYAATMFCIDAGAVAAVHWTQIWVPALALSPLAFLQVWLFVKGAGRLASRKGCDH
jgi:hypothetical protein